MFNQKIILITLSIFIVLSFSFLAIIENNQNKLKDGWFLYFKNPQALSLDFTIENYTNKKDFSWELFLNETPIDQGSLSVLKNNQESVIINQPLNQGSVKIKVYCDKEVKTLYRNNFTQ